MKCCRPPSFSSTIMGRSRADHGQIMGRSWADHGRSIHAEKSWKFQLFPIPFFPKNYENLRFSHSVWTKRLVILADPAHVFFGKKRLYFWSNINFTHWNRLFSQQWLILHVETGMFCKDLLDSARSVVFGRTTMTSQLKRWRIRYLGQWRVRRRKTARVTRQCDARPSWAAASFVRVCSRTIPRNWRRRGTPRCCSIHGLITCAMSTIQKWWIRSVPCWTNPRTTP